jgi:hypothetical protein
MKYKIFVLVPLLLLAYVFPQENKVDKDQSLHFLFDIDSINLNIGESADINIKLLNEKGEPSNTVFSIYGTPRGALKTHPRISDSTGFARVSVTPYKSGTHKLNVRTGYIEDQVVSQINVEVPSPQISNIVFNNNETTYYSKTINSFSYTIFDKAGLIRNNENVKLTSSKSAVADFDFFGNLEARKPGKTIIKAKLGAVVEEVEIKVIKNPVKSITISADENEIRTGDVLYLNAKAWNKSGKIIEDAPIQYSYSGKADFGEYALPAVGQAGLHASGLVTDDGRFVAETVGLYTISASFGGVFTSKVIKVVARDIQKEIELVGHGLVNDVFTSDLWVWEGIGKHKGKDFAATGTFGANGEAYFWDVTDPKNMVIIDTITVDARTVNDIKVSEDGKIAVITREGASDRKNGFLILDVTDPYNVEIDAEYNDGMTGGVHNVFIADNHVYAVNNGRKYDIINIEDPRNPFRVAVYELDTPGHSIHDVWIEDGIAYSSNWKDGLQIVDVGGIKFDEKTRSEKKYNPLLMKAGKGSPSNPIKLANMPDPNGHNHTAFPFNSQSSDKFYIIAGDEWFPFGWNASQGKLSDPRGGYHFMDFTDPDNPKEEAIFQLPEAGAHNLWIQGDTLIGAMFHGGLRVVDISGELLGDLYKQGREIATFSSPHKKGVLPNAPFLWGAQPHKGMIFFSDLNSGLYCVRLIEKGFGDHNYDDLGNRVNPD